MDSSNTDLAPYIDPDSGLQPAPEPGAFDYALAVAKIAGLTFPFLGSAVAFLDSVTTPARGKRFTEWCEELRLRLNALNNKVTGMTPETLAKDDAFISAFAQATQAALRTHQREKLEALRNAVLNVAIGTAPSENLQAVFLNLVDSFTPLHLEVLRYFQDRSESQLHRLKSHAELTDLVIADLNARKLIGDSFPTPGSNLSLPGKLINQLWAETSLGQQFLNFIRSPV